MKNKFDNLKVDRNLFYFRNQLFVRLVNKNNFQFFVILLKKKNRDF